MNREQIKPKRDIKPDPVLHDGPVWMRQMQWHNCLMEFDNKEMGQRMVLGLKRDRTVNETNKPADIELLVESSNINMGWNYMEQSSFQKIYWQ